MRYIVSVISCILIGVFAADAQSIPNYKDAATQCDSAIAERTKKIGETYSSDIYRLKSQFQKEGDLEKAVAADKEWGRFVSQKTLGSGDIVEQPAELQQVQQKFVGLFSQVAQTVAQEQIETLNDIKKQFVRDGKLDEGMAVQQEIEKIKRRYLASVGAEGSSGGVRGKPFDIVTQCEAEIRQKVITAQAQYAKELEALAKSYQAKGELESVFAVKNEQDRFMNSGRIEDANIVPSPVELRNLQAQYKALPEQIGQRTAKQYLTSMEEKKKNLTVEGKLDEAMSVKKDIEKIQARYSVEVKSDSANSIAAITRAMMGKWRVKFSSGSVYTKEFLADGSVAENGTHSDWKWYIYKDRVMIRRNSWPDWAEHYLFPIRPDGVSVISGNLTGTSGTSGTAVKVE